MSASRKQYVQNGYVVLKDLLSVDEVARYRTEIQELSGLGDSDYCSGRFECPDGVTKHRQFWPMIFLPKLLDTVRELIGPRVFYTRHSDVHAHRGGRGWHRDSACRDFGVGPDWDESIDEYKIVRVAIYLQSYEESGSSLGVVPGSHRYESRVSDGEMSYWRRLFGLARRLGLVDAERIERIWSIHQSEGVRTGKPSIPYVTPPQLPVWVRTEPGDCVVFNQRLLHTASESHGPKYSFFLSYGGDNQHTENHLQYYLHYRKDLDYGPLDAELESQLKGAGLFHAPPPEAELEGFTGVQAKPYV